MLDLYTQSETSSSLSKSTSVLLKPMQQHPRQISILLHQSNQNNVPALLSQRVFHILRHGLPKWVREEGCSEIDESDVEVDPKPLVLVVSVSVRIRLVHPILLGL